MAFKKGNSGRPKGTLNNKTKILQNFIESIVNNEEINEKVIAELKKLEGKAFIDSLTNLYEYVAPKLQRSEIEQTNYNIDFEDMSREEVIELINELSESK